MLYTLHFLECTGVLGFWGFGVLVYEVIIYKVSIYEVSIYEVIIFEVIIFQVIVQVEKIRTLPWRDLARGCPVHLGSD